MTEWQQIDESVRATREQSDARWYMLYRQQEEKMDTDEPTTVGVLIDATEEELECSAAQGQHRAPEEDVGPEQDFEEVIEETRFALFHTFSADPGPIGEENGYVCPAHRWLPVVREAAAKLEEAAAQMLAEIPAHLKREAKAARFVSSGWDAVDAPEARRLLQVRAVVVLLNGLVDELANEGRPRTLPQLKLVKVGRGE